MFLLLFLFLAWEHLGRVFGGGWGRGFDDPSMPLFREMERFLISIEEIREIAVRGNFAVLVPNALALFVVRRQCLCDLEASHLVNPDDLRRVVVGTEPRFCETTKGLRCPFDGQARIRRHVRNREMIETDHVRVRARQEVHRDNLRLRS